MDHIYSRATQVLICLGDYVRDIDTLHTSLTKLEEACLSQNLNYTWINEKERFAKASSSTVDAPHWELVEELFSAPWFRRLWVIQEFALARHVLFYTNGNSF